jgi:DNA repair photolyase
MLAAKDFDLYSPNDAFGVTLTFDNDADSRHWEPGAALPAYRIASLKEAHRRNIRTWISMESVIYPQQTMHLIEMSNEFVDCF